MKPIEHSSEVNETEKGDGQLLITSSDTAECFDALKEVLDAMSLAVEAAVEGKDIAAAGLGRDADANPKRGEFSCEGTSVEAFVRDEPSSSQRWEQRLNSELIVTLSTVQHAGYQATAQIDRSGQFAVQSSFGFTYGLGGLAATRVGSVLMHFDVRAIDESQRATRLASKPTQDLGPQPNCDPPTPSRVDRIPRPVSLRQIPPRRSGTHDPADRRDHQLVIFARPTAQILACTAPEYRRSYINFFSRFHSGPFNHRRLEQNIFRYRRLLQLEVS